jgi:hypothetical protein
MSRYSSSSSCEYGRYLYFHKCPNKEEFHRETVRTNEWAVPMLDEAAPLWPMAAPHRPRWYSTYRLYYGIHGGTPPRRSAPAVWRGMARGASRRIEVRLHGGSTWHGSAWLRCDVAWVCVAALRRGMGVRGCAATWHGCAWLRCDGRGAQVRKLKDLHKFDCLRANKSTSAFGLEAINRPQTNAQTTAWNAAVMLCCGALRVAAL